MRRLFLSAAFAATLGSPALAAPPNPPNPTGPTHPAQTTFGPTVSIELAPHSDTTVRRLTNLALPTTGTTPLERASSFLAAHRTALGLSKLRYEHRDTTALPRGLGHVVRFGLSLEISKTESLEIQDTSLTVRLDASGRVRAYTSDALPFALASTMPAITPEAASEAARAHYAAAAIGTPRLVVRIAAAHHAALAYRLPVALVPLQAHFFVWVDARTGAILDDAPAGFDQPVRRLPLRSTEAPK
jgi:hypothetical protein